MDKRYQVFVSSTYTDLKDERQEVIKTIMKLNCIPAGMELFPAADEEQMEFIKRIIKDCDYYILIIGGRYGSLSQKGISFTEQEFDYAISIGLPVLAFIHKSPDDISFGKSEQDPTLREKLNAFKERVSGNRIVNYWENTSDLPSLVATTLANAINNKPAIGWIRANNISYDGSLHKLKKENDALRMRLKDIESNFISQTNQLAGLDEMYKVWLEWTEDLSNTKQIISITASWGEMFAYIAPVLVKHPTDTQVNKNLGSSLYSKIDTSSPKKVKIQYDDFMTIRTQFKALGLIELEYLNPTEGQKTLIWSLTDQGESIMENLLTVKAGTKEPKYKTNTRKGIFTAIALRRGIFNKDGK